MESKKIVYISTKDIVSVIICLFFTILSFILTPVFWFGAIFFGCGTIILLYKYFNPKNKVLRWNSKEAKELREKDFHYFYNSKGDFEFYDWGFYRLIDNQEFIVYWDEIQRITAYKEDIYTFDEIHLVFDTKENIQLTVNESLEGWHQLLLHLNTAIPKIDPNWLMKIATPAFERNETVIYNKIHHNTFIN